MVDGTPKVTNDCVRRCPGVPKRSSGILQGVTRVTGCSKCHGLGRVGSGQKVFKISRVESGRVKDVFKSRGSGQVGSGRVKISRIGSSRVGLGTFRISRVGLGHDPRKTGNSRVGPALPASFFLLTRGSDPRIRPAGLLSETFRVPPPKGFSRINTQ